ncbi:hypothetical protein TSAR_001441 [Trichomalopsis sarcophagae]|uniref:Chitin-binding type-2 domain-containing protein n=1 Tax=Trichomalopsis sarcophagae TaxID=543379 RepID=A0A232EPJ6_9HYME|nr:hypothetical protein TSAR_001441 [Trichomalopsis sarcophagae]
MTTSRIIFILALAAVVWSCVFGLQRPPPRYSQQYMPQTSFTCRNKIVGSYYADPETDCQLFHVCVSVAGSIQDYRFLCPNDTAFDQESQTCADWYDVDCEAATLYYASDNFDLYRIGSGLESLHYDSIRSDYEPQDHLQRSESNDPIRSPLNSFSSNNYKDLETSKKSSINKSNEYSLRNQKQVISEIEKDRNLREHQESEKKVNGRKINRKPVNSGFTSTYTTKFTTVAPALIQQQTRYYDNKSFGQQNMAYTTPTSVRTSLVSNTPNSKQGSVTTLRPTTKYITTQTTARSIASSQATYSNYPTTTIKTAFHNNNFDNINRFETTAKPTNAISNRPEPQSYSAQFSQATSPTTKQPSLDYQLYNQGDNYDQRIYNNYNSNYVHRPNSTTHASSSTTVPSQNKNNNHYNNYNDNNYNNYNTFNNNYPSKKLADYNSNSYTANTYVSTTYNPVTNKYANSRQYYDKSTTVTTKPAHFGETDSIKTSKKVTHYKGYHNYETSSKSYDFSRSSIGLGFSPSSVNHLAENVKSTTPTPRRAASPTTYNPNNFHGNSQTLQSQVTQVKPTYHRNQSAKQNSTTEKYAKETTTRSKITKKNDYDYAYYDNGPLEYDSLELEHVGSNKESVKIT